MAGYQMHYYFHNSSNQDAIAYAEEGIFHTLLLSTTYYANNLKTAPFIQLNASVFSRNNQGSGSTLKYTSFDYDYRSSHLHMGMIAGVSVPNANKNRINLGIGFNGLGISLSNGWVNDRVPVTNKDPNGNTVQSYKDDKSTFNNTLTFASRHFARALFQIEYQHKTSLKTRSIPWRLGISNGGIHLALGLPKK